MVAKFKVTREEKKRLLGIIEEHLGVKATYNKVPECSYNIGPYILDRTVALIWDDEVDADALLELISRSGYEFEVEGVQN